MVLCTYSLLQTNTNCQYFWLTGVFCCCYCCWTNRIYFQLLIKTQTRVHVQYMSTFIMRQIKCHSFEGLHFAQPPGKKPSGTLQSGLNLLSLKMEENIHMDILTLCLPFTSSQFILFSRASYFLLSISSSLTRLGPWGWRKCSHPDISFIQAENGRETGTDRRCAGSWLYSHTLLVLKRCTTGTCVKRSLTLHSLYTGTLSDTLRKELQSARDWMHMSGLLQCKIQLVA